MREEFHLRCFAKDGVPSVIVPAAGTFGSLLPEGEAGDVGFEFRFAPGSPLTPSPSRRSTGARGASFCYGSPRAS
jgi:hypothetical protein